MTEQFPLDPTFAASASPPGVLQIPFEGGQSMARTTAALDDGSTLVGLTGVNGYGYATGYALAKVTIDGELDATFAATGPTPGVLATPWQEIKQIEVDSQGRILLGGGYAVSRLLPDGTPDASFVATCINPCLPPATLPLSSAGQVSLVGRLSNMAVLADDSLAIATYQDLAPELSVTKLTATGDRDLNFHSDGSVPGVYTLAIYGRGHVVPLQGNKILLVALQTAEAYRFTENGALDPDFGSGTAHLHFEVVPFGAQLSAVLAHGGSHLLLTFNGGCCSTTVFARVSVDGETDTSFGTDGILDTGSVQLASTVKAFVAPDLGIVCSRWLASGEFALSRLTATGQMDTSFAPGASVPGTLVLSPRELDHYAHTVSDIAFAPSGAMILVGGSTPMPGWGHSHDIAEVYRLSGMIETINGSADGLQPAVRLGVEPSP